MSLDTDAERFKYFISTNSWNGFTWNTSSKQQSGSKANAIDDVTPHAYNETWDGLSTVNPSTFGSRTSSGSLDYRIPAQELMGVTLNASVTLDPNASEGSATKGGVGTTSVSGTAYTVQLAHESGLEIGGGIESVDDADGK